jgi:hypothetical protein
MTTSELRNKINEMTKEQFISMRDELENNWDESKRPFMQILSIGCINRFQTTLSKLK